MSRRQRQRADYRRVLWMGLAVSVVVHGLLLALGRFSAELPIPKMPKMVMVDLELPEETVMEVIEVTELSAVGTEAALELSETPGNPNSRSADMPFSVADALNEASYILARASAAHLEFPVVPRPDIQPLMVESGLTPMYPTADVQVVANDGGSRESEGRKGGGIRISFGTGGHCPLPGTELINRRFPGTRNFSRTLPVASAGDIRISMPRVRIRGR